MNEQEYHKMIDALFIKIETWLENAENEIDFDSQEGILSINLNQGETILLSKQATLKEVWLASKYGAYHFRYINGSWMTQQSQSLFQVIAACAQKAGITLDISLIQN